MSNSQTSEKSGDYKDQITVKSWNMAKGDDLFYGFDVFSTVVGIVCWLTSGSLISGIIWGMVTWGIASYLILPVLTLPVYVGLKESELEKVVGNFCRNADNRDMIRHMAFGLRRFSLYCEVTEEECAYIGVKLPRKVWADLFDDKMRNNLFQAGSLNIVEASKNIYAYGPRETQTALKLIQQLMQACGSTLDDLKITPSTSYGEYIFSDNAPERRFFHDGLKKK